MQTDLTGEILQQISHAASHSEGIEHLYREIHDSLGKMIDVTNFFIALYDSDQEPLHFAYVRTETPPVKTGFQCFMNNPDCSLIAQIIKSKAPSIINRSEIHQCMQKHSIQASSPTCKSWLAVPLVTEDKLIGFMVIYSYKEDQHYLPEDLTLLNAISKQTALAIVYKQNQARYQNLVENLNDVVYKTDHQGRISYISPTIKNLSGFSTESFKHLYRWRTDESFESDYCQFLHHDDRPLCQPVFNKALKNLESFEIEYRLVRCDRSETWVLERGQFLTDESGNIRLEGIIKQIQERKKAEQINKILFAISNAVNTTKSLEELYQTIHKELSGIANIDNFNIGLFDKFNDKISFVYHSMSAAIEHPPYVLNVSESTSLTAEVIRQNQPLIFSKEEMMRFAAEKGGKVIGTVTESWLGVPLVVKGEVVGAMMAETTNPNRRYSPMDADWFNSVSEQIAIAIERKRTEEQIKTREKIITSLYQISNAMHTTESLTDLYQAIFKNLARIVDIRSFSIALYHPATDTLEFQYPTNPYNLQLLETIPDTVENDRFVRQIIEEGKLLRACNCKNKEFSQTEKNEPSFIFPEKCWLGVPLKGKKRVLGALINRSFTEEICYGHEDIALLESISDQIAIAIEYKSAEHDLISTENELIERAHKAGMADIASDTIHNLGNILNSIKTSNSIISNRLENSHLASFNRALEMLEKNIDHIESFISANPNGEKLLQYLIAIEQSMNEEFSTLNDQTKRLSNKIDLMLKVVKSQQSYVNDFYLEETCQLCQIVDQTLDMHKALFESLGIKIVRQYETRPKLKLQKTKLEHVLMNIINNAREAMDKVAPTDKILVVSLLQEADFISLRFKDSGEGISPKHRNRIFSHGYTTKELGNGFGLHNATSFLRDMGGKIWAESEGIGKGATFIIQFKSDRAVRE